MRIIKAGVFVAAFLVGAFSVSTVSSIVFYGIYVPAWSLLAPKITFPDAEPTVPPATQSGIHVAYAGWDAAQDEHEVPTLKFLIHNGTLSPISYAAHSPESPWPTVTVHGGEPIPTYGCGTGIREFYILPGTSALVRVTKHAFTDHDSTDHTKTGTNFTVAFHLKTLTGSKLHTSPTFNLPKEFISSISN